MRILHIISSAGFYGAEQVVVTLAETMNRFGPQVSLAVFQHEALSDAGLIQRARGQNLTVHPLPCSGRADVGALIALRALIREQKIQILHTHGYKADIYGYLASSGMRVALVSTCHNWIDSDKKVSVYGAVDRKVLRRFDGVVAVSDAVAHRLREAGVQERRVRLINNGVNVRAFCCARSSLRDGLRPGQALVGLVGRLSSEKGIQHFLSAAASVAHSQPEATFVIVGDGPERESLGEFAKHLGLEDKLRFTGKLDDMPGVYASLDILVSSSLIEGLPMTIIEGMAARRPIVATRVGAVPKVVINEETGLLVPSGDDDALAAAIKRLLNDPELRERLATNAFRLVEESFSAEAMTREYLKLYQEVVAHGGY